MHVFYISIFYCFCCMFLVSYFLMVVYLSLILNCALSVLLLLYINIQPSACMRSEGYSSCLVCVCVCVCVCPDTLFWQYVRLKV